MIKMLKTVKISRLSLAALFALVSFVFLQPESMYSQVSKKRLEYLDSLDKAKAKQKFPDQYSELDGAKTSKKASDEAVASTLEQSRQKYLQALILIKRGDTLSAARYFQQAIDILNKLVSYPNVEQNEDFTDLAQSIVEDYESYITNIDALDDNASLFIIRDKLFQEIESLPASPGPKSNKVAQTAKVPYPHLHSQPDKLIIPMTEHEDVNRNLTFLTKNKRGIKFMRQALERSGKWFPMIKRIAENEGLPEEIAYLAMIESGLDPTAVSSAKAVGLWQFMRATGQDYKLNENESYWVDERRDPEKSTRAAMRHLRDLYYEFGDWHLALAAYNCGTGCVRRAIRRTGKEKPTYWEVRDKLPKETKYYVPLYIATAKVAMNPEIYGYYPNEIVYQQEYKYDVFTLAEPTSLSSLAKAAGISVEELKELNPELVQSITPADKKSYLLKIPFGSSEQFAANFNNLSPEEKQPFVFHKVERNESLAQIAKKYNVATSDLVEINNLSGYKAKLKRGDELRIPVGSSKYDEAAESKDFAEISEEESKAPTAPAKSNPQQDEVGKIVTHTVQRGETIYSIANRYGIRTTDLRNLNNLPFDDDNIQPGQNLIIAKNKITEQDFAESKANQKVVNTTHKVKKGETLAQIADNYGLTIEELKKQNKLKKSKLKTGQILKIATTQENTKTAPVESKNENLAVHLVKKGETLGEIAKKYGVSEDQLRAWNPKDISGSVVIAGSRIKVIDDGSIAKGSSDSKSKKKNSAVYYKIKRGDTLGSVAQKYGVSVASIKSINRNLSETRLQIGQNIRIK